MSDAGVPGVRVPGQKGHAHAVFALGRQVDAVARGLPAQEGVGHLHQDAGAVAGVGVGAGRAAMPQVVQHLQRFGDDGVGLFALDVGDHADAAGVVFLLRGVEPGLSQLFERIHNEYP